VDLFFENILPETLQVTLPHPTPLPRPRVPEDTVSVITILAYPEPRLPPALPRTEMVSYNNLTSLLYD